MTLAMSLAMTLAVSLAMTLARPCWAVQDDGQPFGRMSEKDFEAFLEYAGDRGLDVQAEMDLVYTGDAEALARVFRFSLVFTSLDSKARAYGNLLYATFLNLLERQGDAIFVAALDMSPDDVRQRARDFFYYPALKAPRKHRAEVERQTREQFHRMFPPGYAFSRNDTLFK